MTRTVIGGTDCTAVLEALVDAAPPLSPASRDRLRGLLRYSATGTASAKPSRHRRARVSAADTTGIRAREAA